MKTVIKLLLISESKCYRGSYCNFLWKWKLWRKWFIYIGVVTGEDEVPSLPISLLAGKRDQKTNVPQR